MMASIIKESIINLDPEKINFDDKESVKELTIALLNTIERPMRMKELKLSFKETQKPGNGQ